MSATLLRTATALFVAILVAPGGDAFDGLHRVPLADGVGTVEVPADGRVYFLQFGAHSYEPMRVTTLDGGALVPQRGEAVVIAPFQELRAIPWLFPDVAPGTTVRVEKPIQRDAFWDQVIIVDPAVVAAAPTMQVVEAGKFGSALPDHVRALLSANVDWRRQQASLTDPILPAGLNREPRWEELEAAALPLDFQKALLASPHDASPGFAFQNGQWLTTWPAHDLPGVAKEDHWFAPALLIDGELVRPAPLSARTAWIGHEHGRAFPIWTLEWAHEGIVVRQQLFSHRLANGEAHVIVGFELRGAASNTRLALGMGRRPNVHFWDDRSLERTPLPFFMLDPRYTCDGWSLRDARGRVVLVSPREFQLQPVGPSEMVALFEPDLQGRLWMATPQTHGARWEQCPGEHLYSLWHDAAAESWIERTSGGAQARLPSAEWMQRIDLWHSQVEAITRVHYQDKDRLSYGAYFYQYYFGIEEGWPVMALAYWGRGDEAQRQAEIMLNAENLEKTNVHHQSRNGAAPFAAATVARLTRDRAWLEKIAPAMLECAQWTQRVRQENLGERSPNTRGLLPPHIYGGDIRDPATSLYATAACWRGMIETADVFEKFGAPERIAQAKLLRVEADDLRVRLSEVMDTVAVRETSPPFQPLALQLPSLDGRHEGPHDALTHSRLGNYWNLFAPSFLELRFAGTDDPAQPNGRVFDYAQTHGGLWAGLPRFYNGLDAAYAVGNIGYLIDRAVEDMGYRHQALASLQAFFLHAASRNGATIPEVAGLFPYRFDARAYEELVRESPWNFGMYDAHRYLEGHISFTEPLGAGAGEALMLIRNALVSETRDVHGLPDGGVVLLPVVPGAWFAEGEEIVLENFPTAYGMISATIRSSITSRHEIVLEHRFTPFGDAAPKPRTFRVRFAPPGRQPVELNFDPHDPTPVRATF
jgi:hypothetical protein